MSPDGSTVAFAPEGNRLYVVGVDGTGLRLLDTSSTGGHSFSPDGRTIATASVDAAWPGVFAVDLDGAKRRIAGDTLMPVEFHPNGRIVGVVHDGDLETVPVEGSQPPTKVLALDRPIGDFAFSPDGRRLVYSVETNDEYDSDLFVVDLDGSNNRRLTTTGDVAVASWSPNGAELVFHRGSDKSVWAIGVDGSKLRRVTSRGGYPVFSPDGAYVAFAHERSGLRVVRADGSGARSVGSGYVEHFAFVPGTG